MLGFGSAKKGRARTCWGLTFCDEELNDPAADWLDLSSDAYVFPRGETGIADETMRNILLEHCTDALVATLRHFWELVQRRDTREQIEERLTAMRLPMALDAGALVHDDWFFTPGLGRLWTGLLPSRTADRFIDLEAIETLDDLVLNLRDRCVLDDETLNLTRIAFHAAFNPVLLCRDAYPLGELFTVSAWLGMLSRGRRVVMPEFIAAYWLMLLDDASEEPAQRWGPDAFLLGRAEATIGLDALRSASMRVLESGPMMLRRRPRWRRGPHLRAAFPQDAVAMLAH
jgi:hypothetical protein